MTRLWSICALILGASLLAATAGQADVIRPKARPVVDPIPVARWDHRREATRWSKAALKALRGHGRALVQSTPSDIAHWCPGYVGATDSDRRAFWTGLFSALAKHESTWNPKAVGGGGLWFGLTQIDPRTARAYGCRAKTGEALKDGTANLSCAVRIAAKQVTRRGTVRRGMLDWGPFHSPAKRADMAGWVRGQDYCAISISTRPVPRPAPKMWVMGPKLAAVRPVSRSRSARPGGPARIVDQRQIGRVTTAQ